MARRAPCRERSGMARRLCVALPLAALAWSSGAAAGPKLQAVGETSVGYTDNIQSSPDKSAGAFLVLSPGAVLAVASPSNVQRASYTYSYDLFFARTSASTSTNRLEY